MAASNAEIPSSAAADPLEILARSVFPPPIVRLAELGWSEDDFKSQSESPRLIIVGDIHGCLSELHCLLASLNFSPDKRKDRLISVGDLVAKGPDSKGVVEYLMELNRRGIAWAVRGNHDDLVVRWGFEVHRPKMGDELEAKIEGEANADDALEAKEKTSAERRLDSLAETLDALETSDHSDAPESAETKKKKKKTKKEKKNKDSPKGPPRPDTFTTMKPGKEHHQLGLSLPLPNLAFLGSLPLAMQIPLPGHSSTSTKNELLVVHAGIIPTVPLASQDPYSLMYMRHILPSTSAVDIPLADPAPGSVHWLEFPSSLSHPEFEATIVFGHDAPRSLQNQLPRALGLDTGCVYGNRLTCGVWSRVGTAWEVEVRSVPAEKMWSVPKSKGE